MLGLDQRWKNLDVQQIITPRRSVLTDNFDPLADNFDPLADNFDHLADKNVRETFLRQGFSTAGLDIVFWG